MGSFSKNKKELTDRRYQLKDRLRLFDAVVTPSLLYGCETWALKVDQERRLKVTQRKMLRMVLNAKRRTLIVDSGSEPSQEEASKQSEDQEILGPWPEFLQRTAQKMHEHLEKAGLSQWTMQWRTRKWRWAQKLLADTNNKWSRVATSWDPLLHSNYPRARRQARPKKRWEEDFEDFLRKAFPEEDRQWRELAKDRQWWLSKEEAFAKFR